MKNLRRLDSWFIYKTFLHVRHERRRDGGGYDIWETFIIHFSFYTSISQGFYLFIFRKRGREGERKGEKHQYMHERYINWLPLACPQLGTWHKTQACTLTRNWTGDNLVHRTVLNPLSHTSQDYKSIFILYIHFYYLKVFKPNSCITLKNL